MTRRIALSIFLLAAAPLPGVAGQPKPAATQPAAEAAAAPSVADERTAQDTKERLREILQQYPPSVGQVLKLDPSLLSRPDYLAPYPTLAAYLGQHPEIAHNPVFFMGAPNSGRYSDARSQAMTAIENVFIGLEVLLGVVTAIITLAWLARAGIDHRRWLRATKIQTDAHNKIVDRLSSNEDLLAYMQSPTGQRFLTAPLSVPAAANVPLAAIVGAPLNRILWSVQAGVVLTAAGIGLLFAKNGVIDEMAQPLQVISILAIALGIGFIASAFASYAMSRQLGLVESQVPHA